MKIRAKTLAILGVTFFCLLLILTITTGEIVGKSFTELEEQEVSRNVERVSAAIDSRTENLVILANDWGHWDDSYYFLLGEDEYYVENNLDVYSMTNLQVDMMLFYDADGQLYNAVGADLDAREEKNVSSSVLDHLGSNNILFSGPSNPVYVRGIINTPEGPMLIASNPITQSIDYETIVGTLVVGRYLDKTLIEELEDTTKLALDFKTPRPEEIQNPVLSASSQDSESLNVEYLNEDTVVGTTLLNDINGNPLFLLEVEMTRDIHQQGQSDITYLIYAIVFLGIVYGLVLIFSLEKYVLSRMSVLSRNLTAITENGSLSSRVKMDGNDELYDLSENINYMLETLEEKENKIQQSENINRQRMESIIENSISGVIVIDEETHIIVDANPVAEEIIGLPRDEIIGHVCHQFVCATEKGKCPISDLGKTVNRSERQLINAKGEKIPILKSVASVTLYGGKYLIESFVDLSKIKEAEKELIQAKIVAESANRVKSDFLATMSHELRTPLNSIIGFSDLMLEGGAGEMADLQKRYLNNISTSGKHLLSLINNVLDLSKIEAGKIDLHIEIFPAIEAIHEVKQLTYPLASKKGLQINYSVDENITNISADKIRFKQILYNLISNAIKFTPKGGNIDVLVQRDGNVARISVKDTGIGISKENLEKLFQPFIQIDSAANRQYEGTGLGLSLVRRFIELHNGKIWVESEEGQGTNFVFELPLIGEKNCEISEGIPENKNIVSGPSENPPEPIEVQDIRGDGKLILVVEDDEKSRELLEATLTFEGYRVECASNGKGALELARKLKPFLITLDIMMPGMDGREVLSHLKEDERTKDIPVIIISMLDEGHTGIIWGAAEHFTKPVKKDKLVATINDIRTKDDKSRLKVLVVDDEKSSVEVISAMLSDMDLEVLIASGGQQAIETASQAHPDIIILDLMMPEVNGFDVVKALKSNPETTEIPIIICTAMYLKTKDENELEKSVSYIMQKGMFSKENLVTCIEKVLKQNEGPASKNK